MCVRSGEIRTTLAVGVVKHESGVDQLLVRADCRLDLQIVGDDDDATAWIDRVSLAGAEHTTRINDFDPVD